MINEIWAKVDEGGFFEGYYEVSSFGRWKILPRKVNSINGERWHIAKPRITLGTNSWGYRTVTMKKDGVRKQVGLHIMVALSFIPNPENKPEINHKNGIRSDNRIENLEWCTAKENVIHAFETGLIKNVTRGEKRSNSKLTEDDIRCIRHLYSKGEHSYWSLAILFKVNYAHIEDIIKFKRWKHVV